MPVGTDWSAPRAQYAWQQLLLGIFNFGRFFGRRSLALSFSLVLDGKSLAKLFSLSLFLLFCIFCHKV